MAVIAYDAEKRHPEWKNNSARATLEMIRRQEIARVLEEASTRADTRYKQLRDASSPRHIIDNGESDSGSQ